MVSVVIPLYNKEKQVGRTLSSVLAQTFQDFEVVIVDDGSTDGSAEVVKTFDNPRIRLIRQANAGVSAARNRGIDAARYDYIALLDADDLWEPEYLATQVNLIKEYPECDLFATDYSMKHENGNIIHSTINKLPFNTQSGLLTNYFQVAAVSSPPICSISIVLTKKAINSIGGFPIGIKVGEDLLTWARLACRFKIAYNRTPLATFNIEGYGFTEKPKREPEEPDIVGKELISLAKEFNTPHIKEYISLWFKMRSSVYLRLGQNRKSIMEALRGLRFNPYNKKLYAYILLNIVPDRLKSRIINHA